jgi:hypothetical protein
MMGKKVPVMTACLEGAGSILPQKKKREGPRETSRKKVLRIALGLPPPPPPAFLLELGKCPSPAVALVCHLQALAN